MVSMPVDIVIKAKSLEGMKDALDKVKEIKEANPHEVIKTTIEIDLGN